MLPGDVVQVVAIEEATFTVPWSIRNFLHEIEENPFACSRIVRGREGRIEAYACAWMVDGEVRINNIAVREASRGRGHGEALLRHLLEEARSKECTLATLEVRPSNRVALALYEKLGFRVVARRKGYYSDTHEDALVMRRRLA